MACVTFGSLDNTQIYLFIYFNKDLTTKCKHLWRKNVYIVCRIGSCTKQLGPDDGNPTMFSFVLGWRVV